MSKLSIYENSWLDLVFEGRNKEYGAYQLRQQNPKTTLKALFFGILICGLLISIPVISSLLKTKEPVADNTPTGPIIFVDFLPEKPIILPEKPETTKAEPEKSSAKQDAHVIPKIIDNNTPVSEMTPIDTEKPIKTGSIENPGDNEGAIAIGEGTPDGKGKTPSHNTATTVTGTENGNEILANSGLERSPEFPGGMKKFLEQVGNKFRTPEIDAREKMKIFVYFVVEKDGSLTNIQVLRDPGFGLGNEAIRVLKSIKTKWQAGMQNGKPVRVAFNLPISVNIN